MGNYGLGSNYPSQTHLDLSFGNGLLLVIGSLDFIIVMYIVQTGVLVPPRTIIVYSCLFLFIPVYYQ